MKNLFLSAFLGLISLSVLNSCKDNNPTEEPKEFDKSAMLTSIADQGILVYIDSLEMAVSDLETASNTFAQSVNESNLLQLQQAYKSTLTTWKYCEVFNIGEIKSTYVYTRIENEVINETFIYNILNGSDEITAELLETKGSNVKGLKSLEWLIFNESHNNDSVLSRFTNDSLAAEKSAYLTALAKNLKSNINTVKETWTGTVNYRKTFIENNSTAISGSLSQLYNENIALIEKLVHNRIGLPLGKSSIDGADPTLVEYYASEASLGCIKSNLASIKAFYFGAANTASSTKVGVRDLVLNVESNGSFEGLNTKVESIFSDIETKTSAINTSLQSSVIDNPEAVNALYTSVQNLLSVYKTEVASAIGVTITFNDNDGD